jgi:hypothetical protein
VKQLRNDRNDGQLVRHELPPDPATIGTRMLDFVRGDSVIRQFAAQDGFSTIDDLIRNRMLRFPAESETSLQNLMARHPS